MLKCKGLGGPSRYFINLSSTLIWNLTSGKFVVVLRQIEQIGEKSYVENCSVQNMTLTSLLYSLKVT